MTNLTKIKRTTKYSEQLYNNKLDKMDKFLQTHKMLKFTQEATEV